MDFHDNLVEATHFEVMRRVLEPVKDDIVDPGVNFEGCLMQVMAKLTAEVSKMPDTTRSSFFYRKAKNAYQWCTENNAPPDLTDKVKAWLIKQVH